jgi:hypothetical protein
LGWNLLGGWMGRLCWARYLSNTRLKPSNIPISAPPTTAPENALAGPPFRRVHFVFVVSYARSYTRVLISTSHRRTSTCTNSCQHSIPTIVLLPVVCYGAIKGRQKTGPCRKGTSSSWTLSFDCVSHTLKPESLFTVSEKCLKTIVSARHPWSVPSSLNPMPDPSTDCAHHKASTSFMKYHVWASLMLIKTRNITFDIDSGVRSYQGSREWSGMPIQLLHLLASTLRSSYIYVSIQGHTPEFKTQARGCRPRCRMLNACTQYRRL